MTLNNCRIGLQPPPTPLGRSNRAESKERTLWMHMNQQSLRFRPVGARAAVVYSTRQLPTPTSRTTNPRAQPRHSSLHYKALPRCVTGTGGLAHQPKHRRNLPLPNSNSWTSCRTVQTTVKTETYSNDAGFLNELEVGDSSYSFHVRPFVQSENAEFGWDGVHVSTVQRWNGQDSEYSSKPAGRGGVVGEVLLGGVSSTRRVCKGGRILWTGHDDVRVEWGRVNSSCTSSSVGHVGRLVMVLCVCGWWPFLGYLLGMSRWEQKEMFGLVVASILIVVIS